MAHKHHPKEARTRAVQQHDGGRPASKICKEMKISPAMLKRWRDQLHLLAPPDAAKMREQEKTIEHIARFVAEQAVQISILQMALEKNAEPWEVRQLASEVTEQLTPASVRRQASAASGPEGRFAPRLPRASERLVCRTLDVNRNALRYRQRPGAAASEIRRRVIALSLALRTRAIVRWSATCAS